MMLALMLAIPDDAPPAEQQKVCRKVSSPGRLLAARVSIKRPNRRGPTKVPASATLAAINANTRPRSGANRYMTRAYSRTKFMRPASSLVG